MNRRFKWLFALAGLWLALWAGDRVWGGHGLAAAEPDRFVADLAVRQGRLVDGQTEIQWFAPKQMRIERERGPRAWKTTLTFTGDDALRGRLSDNDVAGIVDDGEDTLQAIDRAGRRRPIRDMPGLDQLLGGPGRKVSDAPRPARRRRLDSDWLETFVATPAGRDRRARAVAASLGPVRGKVRGLDRYVSTEGRITREVLLDPSSLVPLEVNEATDGRLNLRTTMTYQPDARGALTRTGMRIEQRGGPTHTTIIDLQYSNIRLPKGGVS